MLQCGNGCVTVVINMSWVARCGTGRKRVERERHEAAGGHERRASKLVLVAVGENETKAQTRPATVPAGGWRALCPNAQSSKLGLSRESE